MSIEQNDVTIELARPTQAVINAMSGLIVNNFLTDPMYYGYSSKVRDYLASVNSPEHMESLLRAPQTTCSQLKCKASSLAALSWYMKQLNKYADTPGASWRVRRMHVGPSFRQRGIAGRLLTQAEDFVKEKRHDVIYAEPTPEAVRILVSRGW